VEEETIDPEFHYQRFLRLYLEQSYNLSTVDEDDFSAWEYQETRKSFSPIFGRLELTPGNTITLEADAKWSTYENALISRNFSTTLWDRRGDQLSLEHRYRQKIPDIDQEGLKSAYAKLLISMTETLSATVEYEKDLNEDHHILTSIGALYKAQCWSFQLTYTREEKDERYDFMIGFRGLGEIESDF
jgi:lipopolysaccharide assembly outer membrane protein LptD (OstA)